VRAVPRVEIAADDIDALRADLGRRA